MANTFDWIELNGRDLILLTDFYVNVFGWKVSNEQTVQGYKFRIFSTNGIPRQKNISRFGIWQNPNKQYKCVLVYIWVDNIDNTISKIKQNGGKILESKNDVGPGYRVVFSDPEGNIFALFEDK
jgi:predicted enzyme related to lactoylglutathione lyase